jgi:hypothetical protein
MLPWTEIKFRKIAIIGVAAKKTSSMGPATSPTTCLVSKPLLTKEAVYIITRVIGIEKVARRFCVKYFSGGYSCMSIND